MQQHKSLGGLKGVLVQFTLKILSVLSIKFDLIVLFPPFLFSPFFFAFLCTVHIAPKHHKILSFPSSLNQAISFTYQNPKILHTLTNRHEITHQTAL